MAPLFAVLIVIACWDCVRTAIRHSVSDYRRSQHAATRAATPAARRAVLRRHAGSWWTREILHLFPAARAGWHAGWLAHRAAVDQRRALREEARTHHLDTRSSALGSILAQRLLQAQAQAEIDELIARRGEPVRSRKAVRKVADEVAAKRAEKKAAAGRPDAEDPAPPLPSETVASPTRRVDGQPETEADKRFFDERESGYDGPLNQDGRRPDMSDPQEREAADTLDRMRERANGSTPPPATEGTPVAADVTYDQLITEAERAMDEQEQEINRLRTSRIRNWVDGLTGLLRDAKSLSRAAAVDDALRAQEKAAQELFDEIQAFRDGLRHDHGGMNEAHQSAPVPGAQPEFYEG